jgi:hypothetical protein
MELHRRKLQPMILYQTGSYTPLFPDSQCAPQYPTRWNTCLHAFHLAASALARAPLLFPGRWWLGSQRLKSCACPSPFATPVLAETIRIFGGFPPPGARGLRRCSEHGLSLPSSLPCFLRVLKTSEKRHRCYCRKCSKTESLGLIFMRDAGEPSGGELYEMNNAGKITKSRLDRAGI